MKLIFISILLLGGIFLQESTIIIYQLWILTKNTFTTYGYIDDLIKLFAMPQKHTNKHDYCALHIKLSNLKTYNIGPFNLTEDADVILLQAPNGSGKSLLAKAIANLIPYKGAIQAPKTFYLSLDSQNIQNMPTSKGESIMKLIKMALKKDYELFILDEALDILCEENQQAILTLLKQKRILIITHNKIDIKRHFAKYTIHNNNLIKINS